MRRLTGIAAFMLALAVAASAIAALPATRASFGGITSEKKINGFSGVVTFTAGKNGRSLNGFAFQTLGCFGVGPEPTGVDPFVLQAWSVKSVPVSVHGTVLATVTMTSKSEHPGDTMNVTIKAAYRNKKKLNGTLKINLETQSSNGATCGPYTLRFDALSPKQNQAAAEANL
jgi:hypothetical protein